MSIKSSEIIALAKSYVGVVESPPGSNNVIFNTDYYGSPVSGAEYEWCAVFIWDLFRLSQASELFYGGAKTASCTELMNYGQRNGLKVTSGFQPGDLIFYSWEGDINVADHIGILESVNPDGTLNTIEGNTTVENDTSGGAVRQRLRPLYNVIGAYRPKYAPEGDELDMTLDEARIGLTQLEGTGNSHSAWAEEAINTLELAKILNGDGKGNFGWNQCITREAMAQVLYNFAVKLGLLDKLG